MTAVESDPRVHEPIDVVAERLNDPTVAASLVTLLDNAELLSTLVLGLAGFVERGDVIMDSVAEAMGEFKRAGGLTRPEGAPSLAELGTVAGELSQAAPLVSQVVSSAMASPETIDLLSMVSVAATEGTENARRNGTRVTGVFSAAKSLRDPDVQRGLGLVIEIARSLGRRVDSPA